MSEPAGADRDSRRARVVAGAVAVVLGATFVWWRLSEPTPEGRIAREHRALAAGRAFLEMTTTDGAVLEGFFAHRGFEFEAPVCDLAPEGYRLEGGLTLRLADRPAIAAAYRGASGDLAMGWVLVTEPADAPPPHGPFTRRGVSFAGWSRGATLRYVTGEGDRSTVARLAGACAAETRAPDRGE